MSKNILTKSKKKKAYDLALAGHFGDASALYQQICTIDRTDAEAWFALGVVKGKLGEVDESIRCLRTASALRPEHTLTHYNLGIALRGQGKLEEAVSAFKQVIRLEPARAEVYTMLGNALVLISNDNIDEVVAYYRAWVNLSPRLAYAHANLGSMLHVRGDSEEAIECYRRALQLDPANVSLYDALASALCEQGKIEESTELYRLSMQHNFNDSKARSNYLLSLHYFPDVTQDEIFLEHKRWGEVHAQSLHVWPAYANTRDPNRKLRIGYVSSDFRAHSVAFFFEPILENCDRSAFEIICYSGVIRADATTVRLRNLADKWRDIGDLGDMESAKIIRSDEVDILVDLGGHTAGNGLKIFTHKPAPVQVSYLGYPDTTGLASIDYRLTDAIADPAGQDVFHTENLIRLPGGFLCYKPLLDSPTVSPLPALQTGYVTFGSFNNLVKINEKVVKLWAELLRLTPNARLLIKNPSLSNASTRDRYYALFEEQGLSKDKVELMGNTPTQAEHLALYSRMDIALDTFPYNGTTTTCEALWMGVPVVTLVGQAHAGRVGLSLLTHTGLTEWIAETPEQYIAIAADMAKDLTSLAALRGELRERISTSPLCDGKNFTRKLEHVYRDMWVDWCNG